MTEKFITDYRRISILALYWKVMREDTNVHEVINADFENRRLKPILCQLYTGIYKVFNSSISSFVQRSDIPQKYANSEDETQRHSRDYIIVNQAVGILESLKNSYEQIHISL